MREKTIEATLTKKVKGMGSITMKISSANYDGLHDCLVILIDGKLAFVELKALCKKLRSLQEKRKRRLEALSFSVFVIDGMEQLC